MRYPKPGAQPCNQNAALLPGEQRVAMPFRCTRDHREWCQPQADIYFGGNRSAFIVWLIQRSMNQGADIDYGAALDAMAAEPPEQDGS